MSGSAARRDRGRLSVLLAVNGIFGSGAFGVPTNAEVSDAYPTNVTPAGLTFADMGPDLPAPMTRPSVGAHGRSRRWRGGRRDGSARTGTILISTQVGDRAHGRRESSDARLEKVAPLTTWACECAWQLVFAQAPLEDGKATGTTAQNGGLRAELLFTGGRLRDHGPGREFDQGRHGGRGVARRAAHRNQCRLALRRRRDRIHAVAQNTAPALATPEAGAVLLGGVVALSCYAVPTFLGRSAALGLGYGAATCWACFGMTKGDSPQVVKTWPPTAATSSPS